jgi:hypothetical protein
LIVRVFSGAVVGVVVLALFGVGVLGSTASAGPGVCDVLVSNKKLGPYAGDNVYTLDPIQRTVKHSGTDGKASFYIVIQNDGGAPDNCRFGGQILRPADGEVAYFVNGVPIGAGDDLGGGELIEKLIPLAPGESALIKQRVQVLHPKLVYKATLLAGACCPGDIVKTVLRIP